MYTTIWLANLETKDQLGDPDMDWSITSKGDLQKYSRNSPAQDTVQQQSFVNKAMHLQAL
jgi:hypothetical protein